MVEKLSFVVAMVAKTQLYDFVRLLNHNMF